MLPPSPTALAHHAGPRLALHKMAEEGISRLFVLGQNRRLKDVVTAEDAAQATDHGKRTLQGIIRPADKRVFAETSIQDIVSLLASDKEPVAVVDDKNGRLLGIIVQGSLLAGLADKGRTNNGF